MSIADEMADIEVELGGHTFKRSELETALNAVTDADDWKGPIDAVIDANDLLITQAAVVFFTATNLDVKGSPEPGKLRVTSIGYRAGPAGDH